MRKEWTPAEDAVLARMWDEGERLPYHTVYYRMFEMGWPAEKALAA